MSSSRDGHTPVDELEQIAATLKAFIRSQAEVLLALPLNEHAELYRVVHSDALQIAEEHGRSNHEAEAWAAKIVQLTRAMLQALEQQAASISDLASHLETALEVDEVELMEGARRGTRRG